MEKNLINEAIARDEKDNFNKAPSARQNANLNKLVEAIRSCGVSFGVWEKKSADGKASGLHGWTSMVGDEKKTVLRNLPDKLPEIIDAEHGDTVALIWKVLFSLLLKIIDFYHWLFVLIYWYVF